MSKNLSVALATLNEEENIENCLRSVKDIANEIIVVDEGSTDKTREVARKFGAKVYKVKHEPIFHKTKQKAIDKATGDWILQLDADERVSKKLAKEIKKVIGMSDIEIEEHQELQYSKNRKLKILFQRHQKAVEQMHGPIGKDMGGMVAFYIPRVNYFLGKPLRHAGVYPDGVIRLIKHGYARLPGKSVHELMRVDGKVGWLFNNLEHHDSPTLNRYLSRMNRYTDLQAEEMKKKGVGANYWNLIKYSFILPFFKFVSLYIRHKGIKDGMRGFIWSMFSALHFPLAYFKYWQKAND